MRKRKKLGRGTDATGRTKNYQNDQGFLRLFRTDYSSEAFGNLSAHARLAIFHFCYSFNGGNNGRIRMSVKELAKGIHCSPNTATKVLHELIQTGFIKRTLQGTRPNAGGSAFPRASEYEITWEKNGDKNASRDFTRTRLKRKKDQRPPMGTRNGHPPVEQTALPKNDTEPCQILGINGVKESPKMGVTISNFEDPTGFSHTSNCDPSILPGGGGAECEATIEPSALHNRLDASSLHTDSGKTISPSDGEDDEAFCKLKERMRQALVETLGRSVSDDQTPETVTAGGKK